jgi:small subunit ribosomal protein S4
MGSTIPRARQLVNHRHILVNGHIVDIPSFPCKPRDIITTKDNQRSKRLVQNYIPSFDPDKLPKHLTVDTLQYKGLVKKSR